MHNPLFVRHIVMSSSIAPLVAPSTPRPHPLPAGRGIMSPDALQKTDPHQLPQSARQGHMRFQSIEVSL
jgi:hypothetical protein